MSQSGFEALLSGHTLGGRYHVEDVIGRGGFAAVYRATDERLGRTVAVKVMTHPAPTAELRGELQRRFAREARAAASIRHPNVVTVYDFGTDDALGLDYLVMELLHGEVLSERLRRLDPIPVDEAVRILLEAAAGVEAGHRAGLIHRDVKPGNLLLSSAEGGGRGHVFVLDFGIARFTEQDATQLTHSGNAFLSPAYAAPEMLRGERKLTPAADVFGLGVIGYQLLARERPFGDRTNGTVPAPVPLTERTPDVPPAVAAVIHRAMAEDPADRFPDAGAFAHALRNAIAAPQVERRTFAAAPAAAPAVDAAPVPPPAAVPAPEPEPVRARAVEPAPREPAPAPEPAPVAERAPAAKRRTSPALWAIPLLLVVLAAVWLLASRGGGNDRVAAGDEPRATDPAARPASPANAPPGATPPRKPPATGADVPVNEAPSVAIAPSSAATGAAPAGASPPAAAAPGTAASPRAPASTAPAPVRRTPPAAAPAPSVAVGGRASSPEAMAANRQGEGLFERGDLAGAAAAFQQAVRAAPSNAYYRNNLGWALFQLGRIDEASAELRAAVRLDPSRDIAWANIGEVERIRGNTAGAIEAYERFLSLNRDPRRERIAREKLRLLRGG